MAADSDRDLGHAPALPGMPSYLLNCLCMISALSAVLKHSYISSRAERGKTVKERKIAQCFRISSTKREIILRELRLAPKMSCIRLVGASLSEPHVDELNVRNLYIIGTSLAERAPHRREERLQSI